MKYDTPKTPAWETRRSSENATDVVRNDLDNWGDRNCLDKNELFL